MFDDKGVDLSPFKDNTNEYLDTVIKLNEELFDKQEELESQFFYSTDGNVDMVGFGDKVLWCSENDNRYFDEQLDNYEPFLPFIKLMFNEWVNNLHNLKF